MIKVLHVINGLGIGGTENMLFKILANYRTNKRLSHTILVLRGESFYSDKIKSLDYEVIHLKVNKMNFFFKQAKLLKIIKNHDIISSWLYHADLISFIYGKFILKKKVIWNIRHSNLDKKYNKWSTNLIVKINAKLSRKIDFMTFNSNKAFDSHIKAKYHIKDYSIIPNGFDLDEMYFNSFERVNVRNIYNVDEHTPFIISVGRWNIQKNYQGLLKSLSSLKKLVDFKAALIGDGLESSNVELKRLIDYHSLSEQVYLLGPQKNIRSYMSAADIYVSASIGESFSNAIAEAMACELNCVVTDVGDSRIIVDNTGLVVNPNNNYELTNAIHSLIQNNKWVYRNRQARKRIKDKYDISKVVRAYKILFLSLFEE